MFDIIQMYHLLKHYLMEIRGPLIIPLQFHYQEQNNQVANMQIKLY